MQQPVDKKTRARWRRYLANERAEGAVYRELAGRRTGEEREILLALAVAERRHEAHWERLLDGETNRIPRADLRTRFLAAFARWFGSIFVLALAQRAEARSPYATDPYATAAMAADEVVHGEVVRALAARGRRRLSGRFRAAVFGANDGLVSNLALVVGMGATGADHAVVLFSGIAGLLAGAFSMGAGEYVSVHSQRELLEASSPDPKARTALPDLDVNANELALVYRARGMNEQEATEHAARVIAGVHVQQGAVAPVGMSASDEEAVGTGLSAAVASFLFFSCGALIPVLPYLFGLDGGLAITIALILVGFSLLVTGAIVGVLSGASPLRRALRQLLIGFSAAATTYVLGLVFGTTLG